MAVQDAVELDRQRQSAERAGPLVADLGDVRAAVTRADVVAARARPPDGLSHLALAVAADPAHGRLERLQARERRAARTGRA